MTLAYRGHLREAGQLADPADTLLFVALAHLNALPRDSVHKTFSRWLADGNAWSVQALGWWGTAGDTLALSGAMARAAELHARGPITERPFWGYARAAAYAYHALARGAEAEALRRFQALPDSLCSACIYERIARVKLMTKHGLGSEAAALLAGPFRPLTWSNPNPASDALWIRERAQVAERLGHIHVARRDYLYIAALWRHADPELQPYVAEARQALARLTSEPRR